MNDGMVWRATCMTSTQLITCPCFSAYQYYLERYFKYMSLRCHFMVTVGGLIEARDREAAGSTQMKRSSAAKSPLVP